MPRLAEARRMLDFALSPSARSRAAESTAHAFVGNYACTNMDDDPTHETEGRRVACSSFVAYIKLYSNHGGNRTFFPSVLKRQPVPPDPRSPRIHSVRLRYMPLSQIEPFLLSAVVSNIVYGSSTTHTWACRRRSSDAKRHISSTEVYCYAEFGLTP